MKSIQQLFTGINVVILCSLFLVGCEQPKEKPVVIKKVKAIKIGDINALGERSFPGRTTAKLEASMSFRVSGQLNSRDAKVGQKVKKGDVLATLDAADFNNVVEAARGKVSSAQAAFADADADYKRAMSVQQEDPGAISQQAVDRAKAARSMLLATLNSEKAALSLAQDQLEYTQLKAPFDGEVVATYVENFETVIAKQPIVRVVDSDAMEFHFEVPENLISYVNNVVESDVKMDIHPDYAIPAKIKEIGREATRTTRTYPVTLIIEKNEKFEVLAGMAGKAHLKADMSKIKGQLGVEVPASALFSVGDINKSYVWLIVDNRLVKQEVKLGMPADFGIYVKSGLNQGDLIVIAGVDSLSEGQEVRVLDVTAAKE